MRQYVNIVLLMTGNVGMAQESANQTPQPVVTSAVHANKNAPEITFIETTHDFGVLKKGSPVTCKFAFKNTGKEPLVLRDCFTGCHCTSVKFSKDSILPGRTGFIEVHYDSTIVGIFKKELLVSSNARKPVIILLIKGIIEEAGVSAFPPLKNEEIIKSKNNKVE